MEKLSNNCWKLYFIQLSPKTGGDIVYKIGITEYLDVLNRFSSVIDKFNIKVLCSIVLSSEIKAKAFESMLLTIYNNWPSKDILNEYVDLRGQGEIRSMTNKEKMELLTFLFSLKEKNKVVF